MTVRLRPQLSCAVALKLTTAPAELVQSTVMACGQVTTGGPLQPTVTSKVQVPRFPSESVAEQLTVVLPRGNVEPEAGEQLTVKFLPHPSWAVGEKVTAAPAGEVAATVMLAGQVIVGFPLQVTVTSKEQVALRPWSSVVSQDTVVLPSGKMLPEAGVHVTGRPPAQPFLAVTSKVAMAPVAEVASTERFPEHVIVGSVQLTVTVKLQVLTAPFVSVVWHVTSVAP